MQKMDVYDLVNALILNIAGMVAAMRTLQEILKFASHSSLLRGD
jgi:hypothetical protein